MESAVRKSFFYLGIIAALYIIFYYILPLIFKILGIALKVILYVTIWAGIAFLFIMLIAYVVKVVRDRY